MFQNKKTRLLLIVDGFFLCQAVNDAEPDGDAQGDDARDDGQPCGGVQDDDPAHWQNWSIRRTER